MISLDRVSRTFQTRTDDVEALRDIDLEIAELSGGAAADRALPGPDPAATDERILRPAAPG